MEASIATNSYFGLLGQASHSQKDRAALANVVLRRSNTVNAALTKTYQKREAPARRPGHATAQGQQ